MKVRSLNPAADADTVAWLFATAFGNGIVNPDSVRAIRRTKPCDCENGRVVEDDGVAVAYLDIVPKEFYIGRALLTMAGIAGVCTDPSRRMKGYGRVLMEDTVRFVRDRKYDFCILYGIPNYYHKFGFEVIMARHFITLAQSDIPIIHKPLNKSELRPRDMKAVCALYDAQARFRDGNCLRRRMAVPKSGFKLTDGRRRVIAYALWSRAENSMFVREAVARDVVAGKELLQGLRQVAWREGLDSLNVQMPFGYPATDAMAALNSTYHRVNTFRKGCMGQVTNLPSVVRKMQSEWTALLNRSEFANRNRAVSVRIGDDVLLLNWRAGRLRASLRDGAADGEVSPDRFVQMLFGYRSVAELVGDADVRFRRADLRFLEVLFPKRDAFLFAPDQF